MLTILITSKNGLILERIRIILSRVINVVVIVKTLEALYIPS